MKTKLNNTLFAALLLAVFIVPVVQASDDTQTTCDGESGCCDVTIDSNPAADEADNYPGSLSAMIEDGFNFPGKEEWRACDQKILFSENKIQINESYTLTRTDDEGGLIIGNGGSQTTWVNNLGAGDTILTTTGVDYVTLRNITIEGNEGTQILSCGEGTKGVTIENVIVNNRPATAYDFDGCDDVTISGGEINGSNSTGVNVISIQNKISDVTISGLKMKDISGTALKIYDASGVSIDMTVTTLDSGTVADLDTITFNSIDITAVDVQNGVVMNYVTGTESPENIKLNLSGLRESSGVGLVLNWYATKLDLSGITVTNFGGNGVEIRDSSNENTLDGVTVTDNVGYGIYVTDQASGNVITNSTIKRNGDCGIYLASSETNIIYGNELPSNGDACPIGVLSGSAVEEIADSSLTITPLYDDEILVDLARTGIAGGTAIYLELHYLTSNYDGAGSDESSSDESEGASTARTKSSTSRTTAYAMKTVSPVMNSIAGVKTVSLGTGSRKTTSGGGSTTTYKTVSSDVGVGGDTSLIHTFDVSTLPDSLSGVSSAENFFAVVHDGQHRVLGVWSGTATTAGARCYTDPNSSETHRIWDEDEETDYDGDGLSDREEDPDGDCQVDADEGESNPDLADSDGDGLNDYIEVKTLKTKANVTDSDGDGLSDGDEDADHDGIIEKENGETDPNNTDTDGDGKSDAEEKALGTDPNNTDTDGDGTSDSSDACPMIAPEDGICYYESCTPGVALAVEQDTDEDGIRDDDEDANLNCQRDASETDANDADTDGDGISDGVEDYDQDGVYESTAGESNPVSTDSDGDCITDGKEDKNGNGLIDLGNKETSPISTDSDGDGIIDGGSIGEDRDCDGDVESGDTDPSLSDTDGDGTDDNGDTCPWSLNANCVVRYCGVSGFDSYDADGDGLTDSEEDSNGDCAHTASDKESDPLDTDTDDDGLTDDLESCYETNPNIADTDGDGRTDFEEVQNSGETCQPMYNLGSTNPLRAEYGCSLGATEATSAANLPILMTGMMTAALALLRAGRGRKEND